MSGGYRSIMEVGEEASAWTEDDIWLATFTTDEHAEKCSGDRSQNGGVCDRQALWVWRFSSTPCDHYKYWGEPTLCQIHRETAQARWDVWEKMVLDYCGYRKCGSLWSPSHVEPKGCTGELSMLGFFPIGGK